MEKVKEFAYVLIRKKLHDFFFHKDGQENAEQGGFEDVLLLVPLSFIFLGNAGWLCVHVVWAAVIVLQ